MTRTIQFAFLVCAFACSNNTGETKEEKIDYLVQQAAEKKKFVGNVLVADQGKIIYKKSVGMSDVQGNIQNSDTTKFLLASVSKPITAILVLRLADKGLLKLDDAISKYFPEAEPKAGKITIHQLLTHTSGIAEIIGKDVNMNIASLLTKATLKSEPGSNFEYSNSGYVILKEIAVIVTQKKYPELLKAEVFDPAGMTSSGVGRASDLSGLAKGYKDAGQQEVVVIDFPIGNVDGAGSVFSTTEDLYKLDRALYSETLLSKNMKEQMLKQHVGGKYSYGWFVRERGGVWDVYYHEGNLAGFTALISRRVEKDQFIAILSNAETPMVSDLENDISKILKTE